MSRQSLSAVILLACICCDSPASAQLQCSGVVSDGPTITGLYVDDFGGWHSVGKEAWIMPSPEAQLIFHICSIDAAKHFLIAQNSPGNERYALKFSRFEWAEQNGQLFYCQQVFDAATPAEAADLTKYPAADPSDANDTGCGKNGKFAWSQLSLIRK